MRHLSDVRALIKGGGEIGSGVAYRLSMSKVKVCITEMATSLAVTRGTTFSEAVFDRTKTVMGLTAELCSNGLSDVERLWQIGRIPILVDPQAEAKHEIKPDVLVDAILAKRNTGTTMKDAPLVIGVGPGFCAGDDVHLVVESNQGADLGKVITEGQAEKNTGIPVEIGGLTRERVVWASEAAIFKTDREIGDSVVMDQTVGWLGVNQIKAPIGGILRGLLRDGTSVPKGRKLVEVDPVNDSSVCHIISQKALTVGDGVLSAIKMKLSDGR
ncbi:MAG: selenium-dependent molybdenum cofactor biosynthesis protein YqeB [Dehalococcoidia bacterium]|nr:selenium-dependent molybdenum cofactor biosynthesis protein YqeB [Dehalococcoidia bacterium]